VRRPPLVEKALTLAGGRGFQRSCSDEVGALLHVLAAQGGRRRVAEIGTGCGVGAAWIVSALDPAVAFVGTELDASLAAAADALFADDPNVRVLAGDWRSVLEPEAPFDLVFVDAADAKDDADAVLRLLAPRGLALLDDFTPGLPAPDRRRSQWLSHPELVAVELLTTPTSSAILVARRS